jgi:hypothetical protein
MTSELKVDKITPASGTNTQIGEAGDTTNLSAGTVTLPTSIITGASEKTTLVDADKFLIADSADSNAFKHVQTSNLPSGGLVKLVETNITSATSAVELNDSTSGLFDGTYRTHVLFINELVPSGASLTFRMEFRNASGNSYIQQDYAFRGRAINSSNNDTSSHSTSASYIDLIGDSVGFGDGSANYHADAVIYLTNFNQSDAEANVFGTGTYNNASGSIAHTRFAGKYRDTSTQVDGIKLFFGGGNITKGNFRIYGVVNS